MRRHKNLSALINDRRVGRENETLEETINRVERYTDREFPDSCCDNSYADYIVDKSSIIPDTGCFIQVIKDINTTIEVKKLSVFYAKPEYTYEHWRMFIKYTKPYKVKIITKEGEVFLLPYEYSIVSQKTLELYMSYIDNCVDINWLDPRNEDFDREKLFYIQAKGIRKAEAYKMLIPEVKSSNVMYLTFNLN